MRRMYDYDEFMAQNRKTAARRVVTVAESRGVNQRRRRPRTAEEREAIMRAALARMRASRENGEIVRVAPRLYVLK